MSPAHTLRRLVALTLLASLPGLAAAQSVAIEPGVPYTQNFDGLATSGTGNAWTNGTSPLSGWYSNRTVYNANNGGSNAGALYSFGTGTNADRALGSVQSNTTGDICYGVRLENASDSSLTAAQITYTGEQWRNGGNTSQQSITVSVRVAPADADGFDCTSSGWTEAPALQFTGPIAGSTAGALDGNAAANRVAGITAVVPVTVPVGQHLWIRWLDVNDPGNDHGLGIDDLSISVLDDPVITLADVTAFEGDAGTTDFVFEVRLSGPAEAGGVEFDITTENGTAVAGVDYVFTQTLGARIEEGEESVLFAVPVIGNTDEQPNRSFTVRISNVTGNALLFTDFATGTIIDDDYVATPIHAIQGPGNESPLQGQTVTTKGVVTGIRNNSFYIQTPVGQEDNDPDTSEGLYIFVNTGNVPSWMAVGDLVLVTGTVVEFVPAADPGQLPITQIAFPDSVTRLLPGQLLPAPVVIDLPLDPDGGLEQLERYEFMRVRIPEFHVTAPTRPGSTDEYFGVIAGNDRPFRESGIDVHDPLPDEAPANVPSWDANPELIRVKSNLLLGGAAAPVRAGTVLEELSGILDYSFRRYTVLTRADEAPSPVFVPEGTATSLPLPQDVTIGGFNVENLSGGPGNADFDRKSAKISQVVREYLHYPDILGIIEVASPETLTALANRINADAVTAGDTNPGYVAEVIAASGTQRLGFVYKTASIEGGAPRVQRIDMQERDLFLEDEDGNLTIRAGVLCPDGVTRTSGLLNDRPPLFFDAVVNGPNGAGFPVTVINNHLKSLIGIDSFDPAGAAYACFNFDADGTPIATGGEGRRNRAKRQQEAEYLAGLLDELQQSEPQRPIVLVGDFNAFEFNDGYADVMGTLSGLPSPDDETVVPGDGIDLLDPDLVPLTLLVDETERYSYMFGGNAQVLDHVLVNEAAVDATVDIRKEFARVNADFTYADASNLASPFRSSDHDPTQAYLTVSAFFTADLDLDGGVDAESGMAGDTITLDLNLVNDGNDGAINPRLFVNLPAGTGFANLDSPPGWSCLPPLTGASGNFGCFADDGNLDNGASVSFSIDFELLQDASGSTVMVSASAEADSTDPTLPNLVSATIEVQPEADLAITAVGPGVVTRDDPATVVFTLSNKGPNEASDVVVNFSVSPLGLQPALPILTAPAGWTCSSFVNIFGAVSASCSSALLAPGSVEFTLSQSTDLVSNATLLFQASTISATSDPDVDNNSTQASVALNTAPTIEPADFTVLIGTPNGFVVGQIAADDADGDSLQFSITDGNTGDAFAIDSDGILSVADSAAIVADFTLEVTVSDGRGGSASAMVQITVEDPLGQPVIFSNGFE